MKTLKEVSQLVGMSRRVIQEYEKAGVAETPTTRNKYGYLLYDEAHIDRLWQIRFYRELGYEKKQILQILEDPDYDRHSALDAKIQCFQKKKRELDSLITMAQTAEETGITPTNIHCCIPGLKNASYNLLIPLISTGIQTMIENTDILEDSLKNITEADLDLVFNRIMEILDLAEEDFSFQSPEVQKQAALLHKAMSKKLSPSVLILSWINLIFAPGTKGAAFLDENFRQGASEFLHQALLYYCTQNADNPTDRLLTGSIDRICSLSALQYGPESGQVQKEVENLHKFFSSVTILSQENCIRLLEIIGKVYESDAVRLFIGRKELQQSARLIAFSIRLYCDRHQDLKKEETLP